MVVVIHAAVTYSPFGSWYFRDGANTGRTAAIGFGTYQTFQHAVAMGLLFGIAGYFSRASLTRKTPGAYMKERLWRLGMPLLLYMFVVGPLTEFFVAQNWGPYPPGRFGPLWWRHLLSGEIFSGSGPLWFCLVLLVFSACYAALWALRPPAGPARPGRVPGIATVLGFIGAMAVLTFLVKLVTPGGTFLNVELHDFPQYPLMFAAGAVAQRDDWPAHLPARTGRWWGIAGLVLGMLAWVLLIGLGGALEGKLYLYGGGWHWQTAGIDVWRSFTCIALTLGLITLYRDRFNGENAVSRFLTRNAFGVYVFHPPILIAVTRALQYWPADVAVKFLVASVLAVTATFLFVGFVARRTPWVRAII